MRTCACVVLLTLLAGTVQADDPVTVTVAVASNFSRTATELAARFSGETGMAIRLSNGSTGLLYAQILNGAPFDVFLAADVERPALLEHSGHAVAGSRFTYARGGLALWSRDATDCLGMLKDVNAGRVALANPATAPYGRAAMEFLINEGHWAVVSGRAVYGENAMQALQFAATGNAVVGVIASAQLVDPHLPESACVWNVPTESHGSIEQQAVLLKNAAGNDAAQRFIEFIRSDVALEIIERHGYGVSP
jgi:molybdate transport system substrate-binding protein